MSFFMLGFDSEKKNEKRICTTDVLRSLQVNMSTIDQIDYKTVELGD